MAVNNALNPAVVQTELDAIFVQEYDQANRPGIATALSPMVFKQQSISNSAHIEEVLGGGGGLWNTKGEEQAVQQASPRVANKATYSAVTFAKGIQISKEYFDDNMHGAYSAMIRKFAGNALATRDATAFTVYRNSFTTQLTADGVSFINAAHVAIDGPNVSNRLTNNPALTETSLNTAIVLLLQQKSQDGIIMNQQPEVLLVAPANFKNATEIVKSELQSNTANNNMNVYSTMYGITVFQSPYLGTAQSGGSDTAWWLLSRNHGVTRYQREALSTTLRDYRESNNDNYFYKGRYREVYGVTDYVGAVGSDGTNV